MGWAKYAEDINEVVLERRMLLKKTTLETTKKVKDFYEMPRILISTEKGFHNKKTFSDIRIVCKDCGKIFVFSAKSQRYFKQQGWDKPKRCKCCRENRNTTFLMRASY